MANKSVIYQKDLKKSRKKCFCFVNSSFVYETCGKLRCAHDEAPQKGKKRKNQTERHKFVFTST